MNRIARLLVAAVLTLSVAVPASAAATLAPLFTVAGVMNTVALATYFACTNTDTVAESVGIEVFGQGGTQLVTATSNAVALGPQATILFGTQTAAALTVDAVPNPGPVTKGSANIWTTSKKIVCSAFLADTNANPPASMTNLTIAYKGKQKGD
jgi:hypothetical protein